MTAQFPVNLEFLTEAVPFQYLHFPINVTKCLPEPLQWFAALLTILSCCRALI